KNQEKPYSVGKLCRSTVNHCNGTTNGHTQRQQATGRQDAEYRRANATATRRQAGGGNRRQSGRQPASSTTNKRRSVAQEPGATSTRPSGAGSRRQADAGFRSRHRESERRDRAASELPGRAAGDGVELSERRGWFHHQHQTGH